MRPPSAVSRLRASMKRMVAFTVCPAPASVRDMSRPMPVPAPVMMMTFVIVLSNRLTVDPGQHHAATTLRTFFSIVCTAHPATEPMAVALPSFTIDASSGSKCAAKKVISPMK